MIKKKKWSKKWEDFFVSWKLVIFYLFAFIHALSIYIYIYVYVYVVRSTEIYVFKTTLVFSSVRSAFGLELHVKYAFICDRVATVK